MISDAYREMNENLHRNNEKYGTSGRLYASQVHALSMALQTEDILDYGCGKSTLAQNLPFKIKQYDPAIPKYAALPEPSDLVVCTDVLEHVEPIFLTQVLEHLSALTKRKGFFIISTTRSTKTLEDGRNAHLIVESPEWWLNHLWKHFRVVGFQSIQHDILVIVEPKSEYLP